MKQEDLKEHAPQIENNIPELQSPFEQLREVEADGREWWNSLGTGQKLRTEYK